MALFEKLKNVFKGNEKKDIKRVQNIVENSKTLNVMYKNEHIIIQGYNAIFLDEYVSDVINLYNLDVQGNDIIINYDDLYEFYYSDDNERIDIYKILNLPELFDCFSSEGFDLEQFKLFARNFLRNRPEKTEKRVGQI